MTHPWPTFPIPWTSRSSPSTMSAAGSRSTTAAFRALTRFRGKRSRSPSHGCSLPTVCFASCPAALSERRCGGHSAIRSAKPVPGRPCGHTPIARSTSTRIRALMPELDGHALCADYLDRVTALMRSILDEERAPLDAAASRLADQIAADRLIHVFGPGGHSNLAAQEIFFRAGGLMHVAAILDGGTLLSNGALRSMAMERTPGYGRLVIADRRLGEGDLLILVNAYGINAALLDA